jgi:hypothetical protein
VVPRTRIIGTYGGLEGLYIVIYFTDAVRNENTSWKAFGSFREIVSFSVFTSGFLVFDLLRLLIAYLLNTVFSVAVKRGCPYHTESDYKGKRRGM